MTYTIAPTTEPLLSHYIYPEIFTDARFDTQHFLGRGRYAVMYQARRLTDDRVVILKTIENANNEILQKYADEAKHLSQMDHPNIVHLFDCGPAGGAYLLVLEYVGEKTVQSLIDDKKQLSCDQVRSIIIPICDALAYLHGRGEVHPFLKPNHIVLRDKDQHPVLIDFAKQYYAHEVKTISSGGAFFQNAEYAAPDVVLGTPVQAPANVYSLGCIMYAMLTGIPPFTGQNQIEVASKQMSEKPKPPSKNIYTAEVPKDLDKLVMSMLEKKPDKRSKTRVLPCSIFLDAVG